MNQRTFLGLTHNPFVPPKEGFFSGADRKTHLEHLRHLSQWSRRILVVSGPFGIGKSTLFRELSANLEPHTKAARLAGTIVTSERDVLAALLQGFGVAADSSAGAEDLSSVIARFVDEQEDNGRACMVMVDDGQLLEPAALQRLISLVGQSSLRMVVFAETTVIGAIDRDTKAAELEWFEIRLTGFPKSDVRDYLEWRFSQAQYRGLLPFTDEQLENIVTKSSGNPGVVDSMASNLLVEMETGQIRNRGSAFPLMHGVLAVLLVAFVTLLYIWFQSPGDSTVDATVNMTASADSHGDSSNHRGQAMDESTSAANPAQSDPSPSETILSEPMSSAQEQLGITQPDPAIAGETNPIESDGEALAQVSASIAADAAAEVAEEVGANEPVQVDTEVQATVADQNLPQGADHEVASEPVVVPVTESAPASVLAEPSTQDADGLKNANWLLAQDPRRYTVQLVTVSKPERARELINEQADPSEFAVYQINRDGRRLNVITFGVFTSTEAANAGTERLTGQLGTVKPWVRPMNLVQDAVRGGL